uniref:CBS domain-containing protein n=1 Tax=Pseudo-nitzschia australis TaxID=44445 RepID=A0A7S4EFG7_9STRA|mmetsp:Transcript_18677/g.40658  ORF Transcript_18677/g.40658 Transcript_18677/m.40658 type:complete len:180 (+) Transcript_18677:160-699(+)
MFRLVPTIARTATRCSAPPRAFSTVGTAFTAGDAAELSGYNKIDFCIDENATVLDAVKIFVTHNIGCLVTTNNTGDLTGIISERDYISKVDLLDRNPEITKVKDIFTPSSKLITAGRDESVQGCMEKMLASDIRHLPLVDHGELLGMISIKDLVKTCIKEQDQTIDFLSDFALGNLKRY